jgi:hypothetical protein
LRQFNSAARYLFEYVVPQVSHSETAIRHQIVAAASLQELRLNVSNRPKLASVLYHVHYGRALELLGTMEVSSKPHVMLISCLLFIAMENIRNVPQQAYLHLQHGLQILQRWKRSQSSCGLSTSADDMIASFVEPVFAQLEAAASMVRISGIKAVGSLQWKPPIIPDTFQTLSEAREKFFELGQWLYFHSKRFRFLDCFTVGNHPGINTLWEVWYRRFSLFAKASPPKILGSICKLAFLMCTITPTSFRCVANSFLTKVLGTAIFPNFEITWPSATKCAIAKKHTNQTKIRPVSTLTFHQEWFHPCGKFV